MWVPRRSQHPDQFSCYGRKTEKKDNSDVGEMLQIDLSKAFNYCRHGLLIGKLVVCGSDQLSLCFIHSYLSDRTQWANVKHTYSSEML